MPFGQAKTQGFNNPGVIVANKVIVFGPGEGVFVYSGTPGPGNNPIDYMSNSATDPFGNALPQTGTVSYVSASIWNALTGGQVLWADGTTVASVGGSARFENSAGSAIVLSSGGDIDLDPVTRLLTNGNNISGLFGNLDPSGLPLSGSATLTAVINAVNSMFSRFQVMGVFT